MEHAALVILVMGVAGAGKTTVGSLLAARLGYQFIDADHLHPRANLEKMAAGIPLTDEDRAPWLAAVAAEIDRHLREGTGAVVACSALQRTYRQVLMRDPARMRLVYLRGAPEVLAARLRARVGHPVGVELLTSQLALLEEPEGAITLDIGAPPSALVAAILAQLGNGPR